MPSNLTAEEVIAVKYKALEQLKEFKVYLEEKIPQRAAEVQKTIDALNTELAGERAKHAEEKTAIERQVKAAEESSKLAEQQVQFYRNAYEVCSKAGKRSGGCWFKKIISFGGWKCH